MRKMLLFAAVLVFALAFAGCRDISQDLHNAHIVTFNPGNYAAFDDDAPVVRLYTNAWGVIPRLPVPRRGEWDFHCSFRGPLPVWDDEYDWWANGHGPTPALDGDTLREAFLPQVHGWWERVPNEDGSWPPWSDTPNPPENYGWVVRFHGPAYCEIHGCQHSGAVFRPVSNGPAFVGWYAGRSRVTEQMVFHVDTQVFGVWEDTDLGPRPMGPVAQRIAELHFVLPPTVTIYAESAWGDNWEWRGHERLRPQLLYFGGMETVITIRSRPDVGTSPSHPYTLELQAPGAMFTVGRGVTLILEDINLYGSSRNNTSIIVVRDGGQLIIRDGTMLHANYTVSNVYGGAVTVQRGGHFLMEGGLLYDNASGHPTVLDASHALSGGGGVWVRGGTFIMNGGGIEENWAGIPVGVLRFGSGAGVKVSHGGRFEMNGGFMFRNFAIGAGGGVYVAGSSDYFTSDPDGVGEGSSVFILRGRPAGSMPSLPTGFLNLRYGIADNVALWINRFDELERVGAGVHVGTMGRFYMYGNMVWANRGTGIYNDESGFVRMLDGNVLLNLPNAGAVTGGVVNEGLFEFWDGHISLNDGTLGAGVHNLGDFQMFGGAIHGNESTGPAGGIFNRGWFLMQGGSVMANTSLARGGGLVQGNYNQYSGAFVMTGGFFFNNRDQFAIANGFPGIGGNMYRRSGPSSLTLARPGFFSTFDALPDPIPHPVTGVPRAWERRAGLVPVFLDGFATPIRHVEIYWFIPPAPVPGDFMVSWNPGRPRLELAEFPSGLTGDALDQYIRNNAALVMEEGVNAVTPNPPTGSALITTPLVPVQGGVRLPPRLPTTESATVGFAWAVVNGHLMQTSPSNPANWSVPPGWFVDPAMPTPTPAEVWPWPVPAGASAPLSAALPLEGFGHQFADIRQFDVPEELMELRRQRRAMPQVGPHELLEQARTRLELR